MEALKETGKARRKSWLNGKYHVILNTERRAFQGKDSGGPFDMSLGAFNIRKISTSKSSLLGNDCKHCGVKLEATGWREINSGNADNKTK